MLFNTKRHPIAFVSRSLNGSEINYTNIFTYGFCDLKICADDKALESNFKKERFACCITFVTILFSAYRKPSAELFVMSRVCNLGLNLKYLSVD